MVRTICAKLDSISYPKQWSSGSGHVCFICLQIMTLCFGGLEEGRGERVNVYDKLTISYWYLVRRLEYT